MSRSLTYTCTELAGLLDRLVVGDPVEDPQDVTFTLAGSVPGVVVVPESS